MIEKPKHSPAAGFDGLEVVTFETRNAAEAASLISRHGGIPRVAPSVEEIPIENNEAAFEFGERLLAGYFDAAVFMTGVGVTTLMDAIESRYDRNLITGALAGAAVIARGQKTARALKNLGLKHIIAAAEPNTWREVVDAIDSLQTKPGRIAVQEYGAANEEFLDALRQRGAEVFRVPVYRWALPRDSRPLEDALRAIAGGQARVAIFTNAVQIAHVFEMAARMALPIGEALKTCVVCSVGPSCSEALRERGISVDLEPEHHKLGILVHEAARHARALLQAKDYPAITVPGGERGGPASAAQPPWYDSRFMRACRKEPVDATPVWLMRQAGRYLKEYRDLRARVPFLELCKDPDRVAEITVTAAERIGADAAILFADLLLVAEPMGFTIDYEHGAGPRVSPPLRAPLQPDRLPPANANDSLRYVFEAVRRTRASLPSATPLIGFAGAPFTLASYLIEGGTSRSFRHTKMLMLADPGAWSALMDYLVSALAGYINGQIAAGVQAVQIFDSWAGCLSPADYRQFVLPYTRALFQALAPGTPVIHFATGAGLFLEAMREAGGDIIGVDHRAELDDAWRRLGPSVGIQGNLDPVVLCTNLGVIRERARRILEQAAGRPGHIFNLGHGVLPETPAENAAALVEIVHEESARLPQHASLG